MNNQPVSEQTDRHANGHDLDKLSRWQAGLSKQQEQEGTFPVIALFLVSADDQNAHNIFRCYRSTFGDLKAEFDNLIIFGQHGASTTMSSFLSELNLELDRVPVMALATGTNATEVLTLDLPKGSVASEGTGPWNKALELITEAANSGSALDPSRLEGASAESLAGGSLSSSVDRVLASVSPAS